MCAYVECVAGMYAFINACARMLSVSWVCTYALMHVRIVFCEWWWGVGECS